MVDLLTSRISHVVGVVLALLLLTASAAAAAPSYRSANTASECGTCDDITSGSYTLTAGDTLLVGVVALRSGGTSAIPNTPTWSLGGCTLRLVGAVGQPSGGRPLSAWAGSGCTAGSGTVEVTTTANEIALSVIVYAYQGVSTVVPFDQAASTYGTAGTTATVTVASRVGALALVFGASSEAVTYSATNGTVRSSQTTTNVRHLVIDRAGATSVQINGTYSGSDVPQWVGISLNPSTTTTAVTSTDLQWAPYGTDTDGSGVLQANNVRADATYAQWYSVGNYFRTQVDVGTGTGNVFLQLDNTAFPTSDILAANAPTLAVRINDLPYTNYLLVYSATDVYINIASALTGTNNEIEVVYKSIGGNSNPAMTPDDFRVRIKGVVLDTGDTLDPPATVFTRNILIFGDSVAVGINNLSVDGNGSNASSDVTQTGLWNMCIALRAECGWFVWGGMGNMRGMFNQACSETYRCFYNAAEANRITNRNVSGNTLLYSGAYSPVPFAVINEMGPNDSTNLSQSIVTNGWDIVNGFVGPSTWMFHIMPVCGGPNTGNWTDEITDGVAAVTNTAKTKVLTPYLTARVGDDTTGSAWSDETGLGCHMNRRGHAYWGPDIAALIVDYEESGSGTVGPSVGTGRLVR